MRKIYHLGALFSLAQCGDDDIDLAGLQVGHAVGADHGDQLCLGTQLVCHVAGHVDVQPLRFHVNAHHAVGRVVGRDCNAHFLGAFNLFEHTAGMGGTAGQGGQAQEAQGKFAQCKSHGCKGEGG